MLSGLRGNEIAAHAGTASGPRPGNLIMLRNPQTPMDPIWELRSGPHGLWPHLTYPDLDALEVPDPQEFVCRGVQGRCEAPQLIGAHEQALVLLDARNGFLRDPRARG
jgi:hypothetical protein